MQRPARDLNQPVGYAAAEFPSHGRSRRGASRQPCAQTTWRSTIRGSGATSEGARELARSTEVALIPPRDPDHGLKLRDAHIAANSAGPVERRSTAGGSDRQTGRQE